MHFCDNPVFTYSLDGKSYSPTLDTSGSGKEGETHIIWVNPAVPDMARRGKLLPIIDRVVAAILAGIGVIGIIIGATLIRWVRPGTATTKS